MGHVLEFLYGRDIKNPRRTLNLAEITQTGNVFLREGGFSPLAGQENILWSDESSRYDGQERLRSSYKNTSLEVAYDLTGGSLAEMFAVQRAIYQFFIECKHYEENKHGEPIWLRFRWLDGLSDIQDPTFGQLSYYWRIIADDGTRWPDNLLDSSLMAYNIEDIICKLKATPLGLGHRQQAGLADGTISLESDGVRVSPGYTNEFNNPSFGHATYDTGWSVSSANLLTYQETSFVNTKSYNSAMRLTNSDASSQQLYQSVTFSASSYRFISVFVKKTDGSEVTSSDMQVYMGAEKTTYFELLPGNDGWYWAYFVESTGATTINCGISVKSDKTVIVDNLQIFEQPTPITANYNGWPFINGDMLGAGWAGTKHNSNSTSNDGVISYTTDDELSGVFSICGWITVWNSDSPTSWPVYPFTTIFEYYVDSNNWLTVMLGNYLLSGNRIIIAWRIGGVTDNDQIAIAAPAFGNHLHVAVTQDDDAFRLYLNGSLINTVIQIPWLDSGGVLNFGNNISGYSSPYPAGYDFDGWRIFDSVLSDTVLTTIYTSEYEAKANNQIIGMPPFVWTHDGDGGVDNVDGEVSSADKTNYFIVGGVGGSAEAEVEIQLDPPTSNTSRVYWLGRIAINEPFDPYQTLFLDFSGTADVGNSSGDAYESSGAISGPDDYDFDSTIVDESIPRGRFTALGRFKVTGDEVDVYPYFRLGAAAMVLFKAKEIATNANFLFRKFGDLFIEWLNDTPPISLIAGLFVDEIESATPTVQLDFLQLLPSPSVRYECDNASISIASGDTLIILPDGQAYIADASNSEAQLYGMILTEGTPITLIPNKYNYIFLLMGEDGQQYQVAAAATNLKVYITPKYRLTGGSMA